MCVYVFVSVSVSVIAYYTTYDCYGNDLFYYLSNGTKSARKTVINNSRLLRLITTLSFAPSVRFSVGTRVNAQKKKDKWYKRIFALDQFHSHHYCTIVFEYIIENRITLRHWPFLRFFSFIGRSNFRPFELCYWNSFHKVEILIPKRNDRSQTDWFGPNQPCYVSWNRPATA